MSFPEMFKAQIESLAAELAETMAESNAAGTVLEAAEGYRATIAGRVAALAEERGAIVQRRAGGRHDDGDGAALALNQADAEGLQPLLQEASARVQAAEAAQASLSSRAAHLRAQIMHVEAEAAREAIIRHANSLDEKLLETISALAAVNRQLGDRKSVV